MSAQRTTGVDVKQSSRIVTQISKSDDDPEKLVLKGNRLDFLRFRPMNGAADSVAKAGRLGNWGMPQWRRTFAVVVAFWAFAGGSGVFKPSSISVRRFKPGMT